MIAVVTALAVTLGLIVYFEQRRGISCHGKKLPRPPGTLPLAGYGLWFLQPRHKLLQWFADMQPSMGLRTYEIPVPTLPPMVLVNDPKNLEFVLKDIDLFVKGDFFQSRSRDLFANGILNADGDLWRIQRKAGLRFLSTSNLKHFVDEVLPPVMDDFGNQLDRAARSGATVDLQEEFLTVTTRLFGKVAYDMEIDPSMPFSQAFEYASAKTNARFTNPLWRLETALFGRRFRAAVQQVRAFGSEVVTKAKSQLQNTLSKDDPLRMSLIKSLLTHIPDQAIVADSATNFLSAGRDTTAQAMSWTVYELLKNPPAMQKLERTLQATFPVKEHTRSLNLDFETLSSPHFLTYLSAVFAEALRLNPAVPLEIKESTAACMLPDGTNLPAGAAVIWIPFAMARSTAIWGPDAKCFVPERWIEQDSKGNGIIVQKSAFENPVFNAGPRMCIGKRMAEILATKILAELFWQWEIELVGPQERVLAESLTAPMRDGLPVRIRRSCSGATDKSAKD